MAFFKLRKLFFEDLIDDSKYLNHLYGLGAPHQVKQALPPGTVPEKISVVTINSTKDPLFASQSGSSSTAGSGSGGDWRNNDSQDPLRGERTSSADWWAKQASQWTGYADPQSHSPSYATHLASQQQPQPQRGYSLNGSTGANWGGNTGNAGSMLGFGGQQW